MSFQTFFFFFQLIIKFSLVISESKSHLFKSNSIFESFKIKPNTIIKTEESFASGAKYLNGTEVASNRECLEWCWQYFNCNLAVYEEKNQGTCYLFNCGSLLQMNCEFDDHDHFTSSFLQINRNLIDSSKWNDHIKHENDLIKLRKTSTSKSFLINSYPTVTTVESITSKVKSNDLTILKVDEKSNNCQRYQFKCRNSSDCIAIYNVCDGIIQCKDGSDEADDLHCPDSSQNNYKMPLSSSSSYNFDATKFNHHSSSSSSSHIDSNNPLNQAYIYPKISDFSKQPESKNLNKHDNFVRGNNYQLQNQLYSNYLPAKYDNAQSLNDYFKPLQPFSIYPIENELLNEYGRKGSYFQAVNQPNNYDFNQLFKIVNSFQGPNLIPSNHKFPLQPINNIRQSPSSLNIFNQLDNGFSGESNLKKTSSVTKLPIQISSSQHQAVSNTPLVESENPLMKSFANRLTAKFQRKEMKFPIAISHLEDSDISTDRDTNSAIIALILGLIITMALVLIIGCRIKYIKKRTGRRGRNLAYDADYLVNGMYL